MPRRLFFYVPNPKASYRRHWSRFAQLAAFDEVVFCDHLSDASQATASDVLLIEGASNSVSFAGKVMALSLHPEDGPGLIEDSTLSAVCFGEACLNSADFGYRYWLEYCRNSGEPQVGNIFPWSSFQSSDFSDLPSFLAWHVRSLGELCPKFSAALVALGEVGEMSSIRMITDGENSAVRVVLQADFDSRCAIPKPSPEIPLLIWNASQPGTQEFSLFQLPSSKIQQTIFVRESL